MLVHPDENIRDGKLFLRTAKTGTKAGGTSFEPEIILVLHGARMAAVE